jgi:hypothetical protein
MSRHSSKRIDDARHPESADLSQVKYELERFFIGGAFDLCEEERFVATLEPECCVVEISYGKLVISCWNEEWSRSWRVVSCQMLGESLRLYCTKQMGRVGCVLTLRRGQAKDEVAQSRAGFFNKITSLIEANLAGFQVEQAILARDDRRYFSGIYTRLIIKEGGNTIAGVAVSEGEAQDSIDASLGQVLIWLEELRSRGRTVNRLALFVPSGKASTIACRLTWVQVDGAKISLYEVDEAQKEIKPVAAFAQADLSDNLKRASRRAQWSKPDALSYETVGVIDRAKQLAPEALETCQRGGWIYLSIRGLTFARVSLNKASVEFGIHRPRKRLTDSNRSEFEELILFINTRRKAFAENRGEEVFRSQAERWLEAIVRKDVAVIDPTFDSRFVYSQVPAYRGQQRAFIDVLTTTRRGRLVIIELKVSEDPEFPFQGLDYWIRIDWHRRRGDFERRGYFQGVTLRDETPLIYLVAPLFRFHATTKGIASKISGQAPVYRVGINDDWRSQLRVLVSERLN